MAYTNIDDPSAYFHTQLYAGNGGTQSITNNGNSDLQPDWIWIKSRSDSSFNALTDSTRGTSKRLYTNSTSAEETHSDRVTAFNSDGFSLGASSLVNTNTYNYAAWQWKANGGTTATNSDGSTDTTVQANTDAGFSIITWTGTGSATTLGHGLGVAPAMLIVKNRTTAVDWAVYHKDLTDAGYVIALNSTDGEVDSGTNRWNHTDPTSSVFSVGSGQQTNQNTNSMVCYAFAEKQGYSKVGKYVGNGSTDGAFAYTGFKPAFILFKKSSDSGDNWMVYDNKRPGYNVTDQALHPNSSAAEYDNANANIDLLSNGFKLRSSFGWVNQTSHTYIFMAFAENPFTTSTGIPTTARALTG
jgi:hypothetical protein